MLAFPHAKINLGLYITGKRPDGFHEIQTVLYPIPLYDVLECIPCSERDTELSTSGAPIPGGKENNLCIQAYKSISNHYKLPSVQLFLHKNIPPGGGLGGGSSNAAALIRLLNRQFHLGMNKGRMHQIALKMGSDCPFFLSDGPALATGRGEQLTSIHIPTLRGWQLVLVVPPQHIDTAQAYRHSRPRAAECSPLEILVRPVEEWDGRLRNDFEPWACGQFPVIRQALEQLRKLGAVYAALSGSGSAVFGLFRTTPGQAALSSFPAGSRVFGPFIC